MSRSALRERDPLGLRRAAPDRSVRLAIGAVTFLAALALGGFTGADALARSWRSGAASLLSVDVPDPNAPAAHGGTRRDVVMAALAATPGLAAPHLLSAEELRDALRPWIGTLDDDAAQALRLPAVIEARLPPRGAPRSGAADPSPDLTRLEAMLRDVAPGATVTTGEAVTGDLIALTRSVQACAALVLIAVLLVALLVLGVSVRSGVSARCAAIEVVHALGATDGFIARRFAARAAALAATGAACGMVLALPVLAALRILARPLLEADGPGLPTALGAALLLLPGLAAALGWVAAQRIVRGWLRRLV